MGILRVPSREIRGVEGGEDAASSSTEGGAGGLKESASCFGVKSVGKQGSGSAMRVLLIVDWESFRRQNIDFSRVSQDLRSGIEQFWFELNGRRPCPSPGRSNGFL